MGDRIYFQKMVYTLSLAQDGCPGIAVLMSRINNQLSKPNDSGLTIIELLVSIAILGALVILATSKYEKNVAKSRRAEAKLALASVYSLEKSFYSEYTAYLPSLDAIGYAPEGYKRFYKIGWKTTDGLYAGAITGYSGVRTTLQYFQVNNVIGNNCSPLVSTAEAPFDVDNPQAFTVTATGLLYITSVDPTDCDRWSINELKIISNYQNGL